MSMVTSIKKKRLGVVYNYKVNIIFPSCFQVLIWLFAIRN